MAGASRKKERRLKKPLEARQRLSVKTLKLKREMGKVIEYDPSVSPHPENWLTLDEGERIGLVEKYHRKVAIPFGEDAGGERLHCVFHCIAENQIAMEEEDARKLFKRALAVKKDRHEAVHELARKISNDVFQGMKNLTGEGKDGKEKESGKHG